MITKVWQRRRSTFVGVAIVMVLTGLGSPPAQAAESVRTFDNEPVGVAPIDAVVRGTVTVAATPFGAAGNRAVRLVDSSTTTDSSVLFPAPAAPIQQWTFDLAPHWIQPFQVVLHGTDATGAAVEAQRLTIATLYNWGKNSSGQVSIVDGTTTARWAVIPELTDQDSPTTVTLTAAADALVMKVGKFEFRTTARAAAATAFTGIELRSPGVAATGTEVYLDNLSVRPATAAEIQSGVTSTPPPTSIVSSTFGEQSQVARITDPSVSAADVTAAVYVGGQWVSASKITGKSGDLRIVARLTEPNIGVQPITINVTNSKTGVTRSVQSRTQSYSPILTSTVVQEPAGLKEARFVDAVRTLDGRIVLVYHYADAHTNANGVIRLVSSSDEGATWAAPITVVANQYDNRDPKIMQLRDGTLLLTTFRTNWAAGGANVGTFVFRSTDGGKTFPEETRIEGIRPGTYSHAPAVELPNGDVLQPLYGSGARVARSTDGGRTFPASQEMMVVADNATYLNREPNMVLLPTGELVMLIRMQFNAVGAERQSTIVRSFDGGQTWTQPEWTDLPTSSHHMLLTRNGKVLLTFGNILQPDRPTYAALITEPSAAWTGYRQLPVFHAGAGDDQGNPSSVELADGTFLSFGYDVADRTVVSWRTGAGNYR